MSIFKNRFWFTLIFLSLSLFSIAQKASGSAPNTYPMQQTPTTYLALGDSYTIGESVPLRQSFPYQMVALLRQNGHPVVAPEIIATSGWTTDELAAAMKEHPFLPRYDIVSLLIGVNNQYRGRSLEQYKMEFTALLAQALQFAGNKKDRVVVLSIPDYGVTPFAKDRDPQKIGKEVDQFNAAAAAIASAAGVFFLDLSADFRKATTDPELVAADQLHPSAKAYKVWAEKLAGVFSSRL